MNTEKVTRVEIIDHTKPHEADEETGFTDRGRVYVKWDKDIKVELAFQDGERTLKVFITDRLKEPN